MKKVLKNQHGITLMILMITIVLISILASVTIRKMYIGTDIRNYKYMCADIEILENKILNYYNDNGTLPTTGDQFDASDTLGNQASTRDNDNYYQIDLSKLYNISLNYGGRN